MSPNGLRINEAHEVGLGERKRGKERSDEEFAPERPIF